MSNPGIAKGEASLALQDLSIHGLVHWNAPFTSGFTCRIPEGTVLVALADSPAASPMFSCIPADPTLEARLVPEQDRQANGYAGYSFVLPRRLIGTKLRRHS